MGQDSPASHLLCWPNYWLSSYYALSPRLEDTIYVCLPSSSHFTSSQQQDPGTVLGPTPTPTLLEQGHQVLRADLDTRPSEPCRQWGELKGRLAPHMYPLLMQL